MVWLYTFPSGNSRRRRCARSCDPEIKEQRRLAELKQAQKNIVVVGGGHAAATLCGALVAEGHGARIQLVCEEGELPYQRPPLSKSFLKNPDEAVQLHRAGAWYSEAGIVPHLADPAASIDRTNRRIVLRSGKRVDYFKLVLATGTRPRRLAQLPSERLSNVAVLRTAADGRILRDLLATTQRLTVLGGGFIGLEVAATARAFGIAVTVLETAPRLLARSVSPELSEYVLRRHRAAGIDIQLGVSVDGFEIDDNRLVALTVDGEREAVELLVLGIGAVPEQELASEAGLVCENGIKVDELMCTSDPDILAIGDCASFISSSSGRQMRLESVQNANDQARTAAATLLGRREPYCSWPWFWSEQGDMRLQIAGLVPVDGQRHIRPGSRDSSFSVLHYVSNDLVCVESINAPVDHMAARKLIEAGINPTPKLATDPATPLKSHL
jgi:3-phenylpropionate/trans-cinnamate dioxygenase ferredoxin reductase component